MRDDGVEVTHQDCGYLVQYVDGFMSSSLLIDLWHKRRALLGISVIGRHVWLHGCRCVLVAKLVIVQVGRGGLSERLPYATRS